MIQERLAAIQRELKAPKGRFNAFGKYKYRSCEDILDAVKPLLGETVLTLSDDLVMVGDRYYIKATARLTGASGACATVTAWAREEADKKGMDAAQITGSVSSYARKYALNGLFLIDDAQDADTQDNTKETKKATPVEQPKPTPKPPVEDFLTPAERAGNEVPVEPLPVGTELRTKVDALIADSGIDNKAFKEWLCEKKHIGKKFGHPSLSTMKIATAEKMLTVWPQTVKAFNLYMDRKNEAPKA